MAFYKKFTPKKNPKVSFSQDRERKFSSNRNDNSTRGGSIEAPRDHYRPNENRPGGYNQNQGTGEGSSYSNSSQPRKFRSYNDNAQQSGGSRYSDNKNFSPSENRGPSGRPTQNKSFGQGQKRGSYGRPADSRGGTSGEYRGSYGKPADDRRSAPTQNRGSYGRPADNRGGTSGEYHGSYGKPADDRRSAPTQNRGPYGRPAERQNESPVQNVDTQRYSQDQNDLTPMAYELPENLLSGRNPIREALKVGRDIEKLMVASGELSGSAREILAMAKNAGVIVQTVERSRLDQITRNHQGMIAYASAFPYSTLDDILDYAKEKDEAPFVVILDKITDPMNLGAIIRSAACAGAHGVIVQQHRAVGLTPSAVRASAGAVEHVKVARVTNINQTIRDLRKKDIWVYAADSNGEDYRKVDFGGACALVIGSEGEGVSQLTLELSDQRVSIPMSGVIDSLNASVAAGILMYAVYTGRDKTL